ncbi:MAG TPA: class I SAM-dependent methyltransferase [Myxococcota bacterium]|nr:class I SAM-dependent methyltransferase [Myxococcota bacterium]
MASCTETPIEAPASIAGDDDAILGELVHLARAGGGRGLLQFESLVSAHQYRDLYPLFRAYVPKGAEVLDWGAGNGHFSYFLLRSGYSVCAFALHDEGFEAWRPKGPYRFVPGTPSDPVTLPLPDASFDAVASVGVLEHVRETGGEEAASLREIVRVLRPGGLFVCWHLPNRWSWIEAIADRLPGKHHHAYRFSVSQIDALLTAAGLERVLLRRYGFLPRNLWGRSFLRGLGQRRAVARAWDALDHVLGWGFSIACQNLAFVARKPRTDAP